MDTLQYREALPFYLTAGDYQSASTMYQNLPLTTDDEKLYAWEAGIAINLFSNGKTWFDIDSASLDSMKRLVQYNKASGYMAGGTSALLGASPVTWPIPVLDTASLDSILAISDRNIDTSGGGGAKSSHGTVSKEKKATNFSAYPNPTSGAFTIVTSTSGEFTLFTLLGQQLGTYPILSGKTDIELPRNLASGIYLGRFRSNNGDTQKEIRVVYQP
jgi:Secretion system C-terminal sorting domain